MVELSEWYVDRNAGVTFVRAILANRRRTPQAVRLESRLDGPTWRPRRSGVADPARRAEGGWTGVVEPDRRRGVGFASPAPPVEPPVAIVDAERAPDDHRSRSGPRDRLADLPDWSPPGIVAVLER